MVGQVPAGTISGEEAPAEIRFRRKTIDSILIAVDEFNDVESVVVLRRTPVFRRVPVVDGDDNGGNTGGELAAESVKWLGARREGDEASAMEVNEHGKRGVRFRINGNEEAEPKLPRGVDGVIEGFYAADRGGGRPRFDVGDV